MLRSTLPWSRRRSRSPAPVDPSFAEDLRTRRAEAKLFGCETYANYDWTYRTMDTAVVVSPDTWHLHYLEYQNLT